MILLIINVINVKEINQTKRERTSTIVPEENLFKHMFAFAALPTALRVLAGSPNGLVWVRVYMCVSVCVCS